MKKNFRFSLLIMLTSLVACSGASEQKTTENKTDSTEKAESQPTEEKSEGKKADTDDSSKDESLTRSLVGRWDYQSGEGVGELDGLWHNFTKDGKYEAGGGMFGVEGTYTVKDGQLIIKSKQTVPEVGNEFNATYTIVEISDKAPFKLTLKNSKGNNLSYVGQGPATGN